MVTGETGTTTPPIEGATPTAVVDLGAVAVAGVEVDAHTITMTALSKVLGYF